MGVDYHFILFFGIKISSKNLPEDFDIYNVALEEIEGGSNSRFDIVDDVMSGKYTFAGKIISNLDRWDDKEIEITSSMIPKEDKISKMLEDITNVFNLNFNRSDFKLYHIPHAF